MVRSYGETAEVVVAEDFNDPAIATSGYGSGIWTAANGVTWRYENMKIARQGRLTTQGMVFYSNKSTRYGSLTSSKIRGLSKFTFQAARQKTGVTLYGYYSTDGTNWVTLASYPSVGTNMTLYTCELPQTGDYYVRFFISASQEGCYIYLDDVTFYTTPYETGERMDIIDWRADGVTLNMNGCDPARGVAVGVNSDAAQTIEEGAEYSFLGEPDRTYRVASGALQAGEDLRLQVRYADAQGAEYQSDRMYRVPYLCGDTSLTKDVFVPDDDLVVRDGIMRIAADVTVRNVYVYPGAQLVVEDGNTLTCVGLYVRTTATASGALAGQIKAREAYYTRIVANKTHYFQFALPFGSTTEAIRSTAGDVFALDRHWRLNIYDTQQRAEQGLAADNWVRYTGTTIEPNVGYALLSASAYYREYLFPFTYCSEATTEVPVAAPRGELSALHDGWNYLCSPVGSTYTSVLDDPAEAIKITELNEDGKTYSQRVATTIVPARPFYYQAAEPGKLVFDETLHFVADAPAAAAMPAAEQSTTKTQWLTVCLTDEAGRADRTHLYLHPEKFTPDYEVGRDLMKMAVQAERPQVYTTMPCGALSFCAVPDSIAAAGVAVGYYAPRTGTYVFSLEDNAYMERIKHCYLIDNEQDRMTDLREQDYVFAAAEGANTSRFALRIVCWEGDAPTRTETGEVADTAPCKFWHDGHLYIRKGKICYTLMGQGIVLRQ